MSTDNSSTLPRTMFAARLHGPKDLRLERAASPGPPSPGQVLLRVQVTGICGSDLHIYQDGGIGDTRVSSPLILGHEFGGIIEAVGPDALDGYFQPLMVGTTVAVDPAQPCNRCEMCEQGHPNLCHNLRFCSTYPADGSLCEWMHMPAHSCFPIPAEIDPDSAALLEPLGVALHAVDLAHIRVGSSVAILGAGPIGLLILQVARLAGASPVFIADRLPWRLELARRWGGRPICCATENAVQRLLAETGKQGVDVVIEAAWADETVDQAGEMARLGGRVVLVGIPSVDRLTMKASPARRKGLTIALCRRMKHCYPRAVSLALEGRIDLRGLVTHRFPLARAAEAFALNTAYRDGVVKVIIDSQNGAAP